MNCKNSDNCTYYKTYRYKSSFRQYQLLVESYCEGSLHARCRRLQYEAEFSDEAPEDLAPNGYLVGTHKKLEIKNTRKFKRHKVKDGMCLLQVLDTPETFSASVVDVCEGGMQLELNVNIEKLDVCPKTNGLKILGYSIKDIPFPITQDILKVVWQKNQAVGCSFVATSQL